MDILNTVWQFVVDTFNGILQFLIDGLGVLFFWLPDDPFASFWGDLDSFVHANSSAIQWLNWFVPVQDFVSVLAVVLSALLIWVVYMCLTHAFEWIKSIKQTINPGG